jgi:hypothetical protein
MRSLPRVTPPPHYLPALSPELTVLRAGAEVSASAGTRLARRERNLRDGTGVETAGRVETLALPRLTSRRGCIRVRVRGCEGAGTPASRIRERRVRHGGWLGAA